MTNTSPTDATRVFRLAADFRVAQESTAGSDNLAAMTKNTTVYVVRHTIVPSYPVDTEARPRRTGDKG